MDLTHYRTSINDNINDIRYIVSNIYDDYMDEILDMCVEIRLTDEEYYNFRYRPRLLSHKLYNTTDLSFILAKVNNIVSDKDFDFRVLNVVRPDMIDQIFRIYEEEKKYLRTIDIKNVLSIDEYYYSEEGRISDEIDRIEAAIDSSIGDDIDLDDIIDGGGSSGGGGSGGNGTGGIDLELYNDLLQRIKELEKEVEYINLTILEILERLIQDDLDDIINEIVNEKIDGKLEDIITRIEDLEGRIPEIMEGQLQDILDNIDDILDRIAKLEEGDISGAGIETRDIVIKMDGKFELGVDENTEFRIPYKGNIINSVISVNTSASKQSNIIFILQVYDEELNIWSDTKVMELHADILYDTFTINQKVDGTYIRIYIKEGDVELISGASIIFTVLEDSIADKKKDKKTPIE